MIRKIAIYSVRIFFVIVFLSSVYVGLKRATTGQLASQDFRWSTSKMLLEKQNPYQKFLDWKEDKIEKPHLLSQAPNYPASALVFLWPFSMLPWSTAKICWAILNLLFTALIIVGLQKLYPVKIKEHFLLLVVLFITGASWRIHMGCGQHSLFVLAFFIWAVYFSKKSKIGAGLLLAVSWFKYSITFPLSFIFLNKRNYKVLFVSAMVHVALTIFVSFWIKQPITDFFFGPVKVALLSTGFGEVDLGGIVQKYKLPVAVAIATGAFLIGLTVKVLLQKNKDELLVISFLSFVSLAAFFHLPYDFVILIFPLWYIFSGDNISRTFKILVFSFIGLQWFVIPSFHVFKQFTDWPVIVSFENILSAVRVLIFYILIFKMADMLTNLSLKKK